MSDGHSVQISAAHGRTYDVLMNLCRERQSTEISTIATKGRWQGSCDATHMGVLVTRASFAASSPLLGPLCRPDKDSRRLGVLPLLGLGLVRLDLVWKRRRCGAKDDAFHASILRDERRCLRSSSLRRRAGWSCLSHAAQGSQSDGADDEERLVDVDHGDGSDASEQGVL